MSLETNQIKLNIHLQPEFGWSIEGEPAFGPGSVLQGTLFYFLSLFSLLTNMRIGQVDIEILDPSLLAKADRLRLVFHGSERSRNQATRLGLRRRQFFGVQRTLWEKSKNPSFSLHTKYTHTFTLQLPLVQFPPTINTELYRSYYMLSVFLDHADATSGDALALAEREVLYRPFLETCLSKTPLVKSVANVKLSTHALDYVPSDTLMMDMVVPSSSPFTNVHMALVQTVSAADQTTHHEIASLEHTLSKRLDIDTHMHLTLPIPADTTPSFSYSDIASVSYKLVLRLKEKKGGLSNLISNAACATLELPIHIGTLGYGIRASDGLQVYSTFQVTFDPIASPPLPPLPLPVFVRNVEYEEALPLYDSDRLPAYYDIPSPPSSDCDPTAV